jgi:hypothetical protein
MAMATKGWLDQPLTLTTATTGRTDTRTSPNSTSGLRRRSRQSREPSCYDAREVAGLLQALVESRSSASWLQQFRVGVIDRDAFEYWYT